jgi:hypothetical protein
MWVINMQLEHLAFLSSQDFSIINTLTRTYARKVQYLPIAPVNVGLTVVVDYVR